MEESARALSHPHPTPDEPTLQAQVERVHTLPREVGVLLLVVGIGGVLLPGPVGTPFVIMGGVVLWPKLFQRAESYFTRKFPKTYRKSIRQLDRFLDDLEHRYPLPK